MFRPQDMPQDGVVLRHVQNVRRGRLADLRAHVRFRRRVHHERLLQSPELFLQPRAQLQSSWFGERT